MQTRGGVLKLVWFIDHRNDLCGVGFVRVSMLVVDEKTVAVLSRLSMTRGRSSIGPRDDKEGENTEISLYWLVQCTC
jgi:hypothetical protein